MSLELRLRTYLSGFLKFIFRKNSMPMDLHIHRLPMEQHLLKNANFYQLQLMEFLSNIGFFVKTDI